MSADSLSVLACQRTSRNQPAHRATVKNALFFKGLMAKEPAPSMPRGAKTTRMPNSRAARRGRNAKGTLNRLLRYRMSGAGVSSVPRSFARHHAKDTSTVSDGQTIYVMWRADENPFQWFRFAEVAVTTNHFEVVRRVGFHEVHKIVHASDWPPCLEGWRVPLHYRKDAKGFG